MSGRPSSGWPRHTTVEESTPQRRTPSSDGRTRTQTTLPQTPGSSAVVPGKANSRLDSTTGRRCFARRSTRLGSTSLTILVPWKSVRWTNVVEAVESLRPKTFQLGNCWYVNELGCFTST